MAKHCIIGGSNSLDKEYAGGVNAAAEGVAEEISMTNKQIEHIGMTFSESSRIQHQS